MKAVIKRVRYKPGEQYPFSFYAEYPIFKSDGEPDIPAAPPENIAAADNPVDKKAIKPGKKQKIKRVKKSKTPVSPIDKLNSAVESFIKAAVSAAAEKKAAVEAVTVSYYIYHTDDLFISFALDVQHRAGSSLLYLRRFCFNWDCVAGTLIPLSSVTRYHKKLRRENGGTRDYNISPGLLFMQKNSFTRESGQNCRRSQYRKFITAVQYDLRALRGGKKSNNDINYLPMSDAMKNN
jgi:hypothetical protein